MQNTDANTAYMYTTDRRKPIYNTNSNKHMYAGLHVEKQVEHVSMFNRLLGVVWTRNKLPPAEHKLQMN